MEAKLRGGSEDAACPHFFQMSRLGPATEPGRKRPLRDDALGRLAQFDPWFDKPPVHKWRLVAVHGGEHSIAPQKSVHLGER